MPTLRGRSRRGSLSAWYLSAEFEQPDAKRSALCYQSSPQVCRRGPDRRVRRKGDVRMMDSGVSVLIRYLPRPVDRALRRWCYPAVLMAKNHRVRLTRLEGESRSGQATMLVAGPE